MANLIKGFFKYMSFSWEKPSEIFLGETKYPNTIYKSEVDSRFLKKMEEKNLQDEELPNDTIWRIDAKYKAVTIYCNILTAKKVPDKRELKYCIFNFFDGDKNNKTILSDDPLLKRKKNGDLMIGDADFVSNGENIESVPFENEKVIRFKISSPYIAK